MIWNCQLWRRVNLFVIPLVLKATSFERPKALLKNLSLKENRNKQLNNELSSMKGINGNKNWGINELKKQMVSVDKVVSQEVTDYYQALKNNYGDCKNIKKLISQNWKDKVLAKLMSKHTSKSKDKSMYAIYLKEDISSNKVHQKKENRTWEQKNRKVNNKSVNKYIKGVISWNRSQEHIDPE